MHDTIQPVETRYKGYRFRSRLEARWAVFFDALGVQWEYEPDGYDLGKYGWYLPDFYLPDLAAFIEVKPLREHQVFGPVTDKLFALHEKTDCFAVGVFGDPVDRKSRLWGVQETDGGIGSCWVPCYFDTRADLGLVLVVPNPYGDFYPGWDTRTDEERVGIPFTFRGNTPTQEVHLAARKARAARFEHGDAP